MRPAAKGKRNTDMHINVKEFLQHAGIEESLYPGKRHVHKCQHSGEYKSHCVVIDWKNPQNLHIEVKAGLTGRDLKPADLKKYPVSFQARTYVEIATDVEASNDSKRDDDEETGSASGRGGGGGKKPKMKKLSGMGNAFATVVEGKIPELGDIKKLVVLGKEIAKDSYAQVMEKLAEQIRHAKIVTTDLMAEAGKFVTKYTPPAFMKARGDEDAKYKYDRVKNEMMFGGSTPS